MTKIDFPDLEAQLAALHQRERDGLQNFKQAIERAQKVGLCLPTDEPAPKGRPFPIAKAAVVKQSPIREHAVAGIPVTKSKLSTQMTSPPARPVGRPPKYGEALPLPHGPKSTATPATEADNRSWTPHMPEGIALGRTLVDPWTPTDLQARLDGDKTRAYYWIAQWKRKSWIETVGFGSYRKTADFGV